MLGELIFCKTKWLIYNVLYFPLACVWNTSKIFVTQYFHTWPLRLKGIIFCQIIKFRKSGFFNPLLSKAAQTTTKAGSWNPKCLIILQVHGPVASQMTDNITNPRTIASQMTDNIANARTSGVSMTDNITDPWTIGRILIIGWS